MAHTTLILMIASSILSQLHSEIVMFCFSLERKPGIGMEGQTEPAAARAPINWMPLMTQLWMNLN